jgi:hypothetical protein
MEDERGEKLKRQKAERANWVGDEALSPTGRVIESS